MIRNATPADIPQLTALMEGYWRFERLQGFDAAAITTLLGQALGAPDRLLSWVEESDGELTGYLFIVFVWSFEHGGLMAEVDELFVQPEFRGRGTAQLLLQRAECVLSGLGIRRLQLQLGVHNLRGRDFYVKRGYAAKAGYALWDKSLGSPR